MNKYVVLLGVLCASMLTGCGSGEAVETKPEEEVKVEKNDEILEVDGIVKVDKSKEISVLFPMIIKEVNVKEGQVVNKGDVIFRFSNEEYLETILEKESEIKMIQADIENLQAQISPLVVEINTIRDQLALKEGYAANNSDPEVKILQGKLKGIQQELSTLERNYNETKTIVEAGGMAEEELRIIGEKIKQKEIEEENILVNIDQIKKENQVSINDLRNQIESSQLQISETDKQKNAQIKGLEIKKQLAQNQLRYLKEKLNKPYIKDDAIIATEDNTLVYDIGCVAGSQIGTSNEVLAKQMAVDSMIVEVSVPVESLMDIKLGGKVVIDAYTKQTEEISGTITRIPDYAVEDDGDTVINVDVTIDKGKELLKIGSEVDAKVYVS
ncbi:HlyD family secretion protein [Cellulosilyticum ruminicola]|uniref:HlyD family secretion protein n=1 Tax=Cellulosilyticum ruminicola TaxID=425254 RepID=UPI0006D1951E|nr:HlyD family efflux transporter periplasmic adaptor subunit [Cellulosilyticum ruminicola]